MVLTLPSLPLRTEEIQRLYVRLSEARTGGARSTDGVFQCTFSQFKAHS